MPEHTVGCAWLADDPELVSGRGKLTIPPEAERAMAARAGATTTEVPSSHVAMISHPHEVAELIAAAASA